MVASSGSPATGAPAAYPDPMAAARPSRRPPPRGRVRIGRVIAALLVLAVLFALGVGLGRWSAGSATGDDPAATATLEVSVPVVTVTETAAEVTQTIVVTD